MRIGNKILEDISNFIGRHLQYAPPQQQYPSSPPPPWSINDKCLQLSFSNLLILLAWSLQRT